MMVLLVSSIILTLAISSGRSMWLENHSAVTINSLMQTLNYARSAAILRNEKIIVCPSSDGRNCNCADWAQQQLVLNANNELLRVFAGLDSDDRLIWNSSLGKDEKIEWLPSGYTNGQRGSFYYCPRDALAQYARKLVLLNTGRLYSAALSMEEFGKFCGDL